MKKILTAIILICFLSLFGCANTQDEDAFAPTLPGADEIYPTILVDGDCYQWRRGRAVMNEDVVNHANYDPEIFLKDMVSYGEIIKESGDHPEHDCGLVCVFDASGTIYLDPNDENVVYLWLTTDWFEDGVIAFDRVSSSEEPEVTVSEASPDSFVSGIIPIYIPSDVILEKVQISSDEADEGVITSICDFDEDGKPEKVIVDYTDILKEGIAVPGRIAVYDADGNELWNYDFGLPHAGWSRFYIAEIDNLPYLIRYFPPTERQGSWEFILQVYTLNSDNEFTTTEVISCDGTKEGADECKTIAEQYLEHAVMLVSTMDSELKVYK